MLWTRYPPCWPSHMPAFSAATKLFSRIETKQRVRVVCVCASPVFFTGMGSGARSRLKCSTLDPAMLIRIVYATFLQVKGLECRV